MAKPGLFLQLCAKTFAAMSCEFLVGEPEDMKVRPLMTVSSTGANDPGAKPQEEITPDPM
jgi:hypothetical protein